jgi:hypothetical protein
MRRAYLLALAALPLLGFDCGGPEPLPPGPPGTISLRVRGAVSEDLWCFMMETDYSVMDPTWPEFDVMLDCWRGMAEPAAVAVIYLPSTPALGTPYGWDATGATVTSNVDSGDATRLAVDGYGTPYETHSASELFGTGKLWYTLTSIGPTLDAASGSVAVHGTLTATVPSTTGGGAVTFSATF